MNPTWILARNTFREAVRDRLLSTVLLFGSVLVAASIILAPLTLGEQDRIVRDLGLSAVSLFSLLLIVLVGTGMVYREVQQRTIETILVLPVRRADFILGKFFGLYASVLVSLSALGLVYMLVVAFFGGGLHMNLVLALALTALEALVITAIAILFSSVASPLLSAVFTMLLFVAGHLAADMKLLADRAEIPGLHYITDALYFLMPSLHQFDVRNNLLSGMPVPWEQLGSCALYAVLYSAAVLLVAMAAFRMRDFE